MRRLEKLKRFFQSLVISEKEEVEKCVYFEKTMEQYPYF